MDQNEDQSEKLKDDEEEEIDIEEEEEKLFEKEKKNLLMILNGLTSKLNSSYENNIIKIYEDLSNAENINKKGIKIETSKCKAGFIFLFVGSLFSFIFLIGIFQIISLKRALWDLLRESSKKYFECNFRNNCSIYNNETNITGISTNKTQIYVYEFYDYFYISSMNETIDFNLMMITGLIGDSLLKNIGFRKTSTILFLFNLGSFAWIYIFDFEFKEEGIFDYKLLKIICIFICYIILLIGIGGSALLSQKILVDSYSKYKTFIEKKGKQPQNQENIKLDQELKSINDSQIRNNNESFLREDKEKNSNKFDYYIAIYITTVLGYFGKME